MASQSQCLSCLSLHPNLLPHNPVSLTPEAFASEWYYKIAKFLTPVPLLVEGGVPQLDHEEWISAKGQVQDLSLVLFKTRFSETLKYIQPGTGHAFARRGTECCERFYTSLISVILLSIFLSESTSRMNPPCSIFMTMLLSVIFCASEQQLSNLLRTEVALEEQKPTTSCYLSIMQNVP